MTSTTSAQTPEAPPIECSERGGFEFERSASEHGSIVKLYASAGITDEVIREGDAEFTYHCVSCGKEFTGEVEALSHHTHVTQ